MNQDEEEEEEKISVIETIFILLIQVCSFLFVISMRQIYSSHLD